MVNSSLEFLENALEAGYFDRNPELEFRGYFLI